MGEMERNLGLDKGNETDGVAWNLRESCPNIHIETRCIQAFAGSIGICPRFHLVICGFKDWQPQSKHGAFRRRQLAVHLKRRPGSTGNPGTHVPYQKVQ